MQLGHSRCRRPSLQGVRYELPLVLLPWEAVNDAFGRFAEIDRVLARVLEAPGGRARVEALERECGEDEELRREVERLLDGSEEGGGSDLSRAALAWGSSAMIGARLGHYEVLSKLGEGGMGEVYRARDTKLGRDVALKVLPADFAQDAERLQRFEREARVLASLNHPHVAQVHGFEEDEGRHFLVMELAEGETLAERLRRRLSTEEAVEIAVQIAEALEAAHVQGIVHRDLKPANVNVAGSTGGYRVKVLDFGLAKALVPSVETAGALSQSPTLTQQTAAGVLVGTAAYMSPEQARGQEVDSRSDIWSLGCVLYEMLARRSAFSGDSVSEVLAAVLKDEPEPELLPPAQSLRRVVGRCLEKNAQDRYQHVGDLRYDLLQSLETPDTPQTLARNRRIAPLLLISVAFGGLVGHLVTGALTSRGDTPLPVTQSFLDAPLPGTVQALNVSSISISSDGRRLAVSGRGEAGSRVWVRAMDEPEWRTIPGSELGSSPQLSPSGEALTFARGHQLQGRFRVSFGGSGLDEFPLVRQVAWGFHDELLGAVGKSIVHLTHRNREEFLACPREGDSCYVGPFVPLDESSALVEISADLRTGRRTDIYLWSRGREPQLLLENADSPTMVGDRLFFGRGGEVWAVRLDPLGDVKGVEIATGVRPFAMRSTSPLHFDVAGDTGDLVYLEALEGFDLWRVDRDGTPRHKITDSFLGSPYMTLIKVSDDGTKVLVSVTGELRVVTIEGGTSSRALPFSDAGWLDESRIIASVRRSQELVVLDVEGRRLDSVPLQGWGRLVAGVADPDAGVALFHRIEADENGRSLRSAPLLTVRLDGEEAERVWHDAEGTYNRYPALSPDRKWVAFETDPLGRMEVNVSPWQADADPIPVSSEGGQLPRWSKDGQTLFFIDSDNSHLMAVDVSAGAPRPFSAPREVFPLPPRTVVTQRAAYDTLPGGEFVFAIERKPQRYRLVQNWIRHVDEALDTANR